MQINYGSHMCAPCATSLLNGVVTWENILAYRTTCPWVLFCWWAGHKSNAQRLEHDLNRKFLTLSCQQAMVPSDCSTEVTAAQRNARKQSQLTNGIQFDITRDFHTVFRWKLSYEPPFRHLKHLSVDRRRIVHISWDLETPHRGIWHSRGKES